MTVQLLDLVHVDFQVAHKVLHVLAMHGRIGRTRVQIDVAVLGGLLGTRIDDALGGRMLFGQQVHAETPVLEILRSGSEVGRV